MIENPFTRRDVSPVAPRPKRKDMATIVAGPHVGKMMRRLDRLSAMRPVNVTLGEFGLTEAEQKQAREAQVFETLYASEAERLKLFFDEVFHIPQLPKEITPELKQFWEDRGFALEYWPPVHMIEEKDFLGWEHKPGKRYMHNMYGVEFFDELKVIHKLKKNKKNRHLRGLDPLELPGTWMLKDARPKPDHRGDRTYPYPDDDLVMGVLRELREAKVLNPQASPMTRTKISPEVFDNPAFWHAFEAALRLENIPGATVRLPRVIEANVMGQGLDSLGTDSYEWCEEYFSPRERLIWGYKSASFVSHMDGPNIKLGFRPLVVFTRPER